MKKYKVKLTPRAGPAFTRIISRLETEASGPVARKVRRGLMEAIRKLRTFPESHQVFEEISDEQSVYLGPETFKSMFGGHPLG